MTVKILVIDDDKEVRNMLVSILKSYGYLVETAKNGNEAIQMCETTPFDVALIDIELPDINGTDLLQMLNEKRPKIVKIIITGHPSIKNAAKSVNEQADGYIIKPFNVPELLLLIDKLL